MKQRLKAFGAHEGVYKKMRAEGIRAWDARKEGEPALEPELKAFVAETLRQPWAPARGRAIELGCGTAPLLRWLHSKGWKGEGVDVSRSAIAMAREEARGTGLRFKVGDVTRLAGVRDGSFDLAVDAHCLHCIIEERDRTAFFVEAKRILRPGGALVVSTMTKPVLPRVFREKHGLLRHGKVLYPARDAKDYEGAVRIRGQWHQPTRFLEDWRVVLSRLRAGGFTPLLVRLVFCRPDDPISFLSVAALASTGA